MTDVQDAVLSAKETVTEPLPTPPEMAQQVNANNLKERLDWGEPALSILDVRSKESFDSERILGAISIPSDVVGNVQGKHDMAMSRDLFVYADTDEAANEAASQLRQAGYEKVSVVKGGLAAWKACGGSIEGIDTKDAPGPM